ncbi:hypothetical protein [Phenylobacterium sp.]|uniref:hypothetical protein n=1 Tax=Phenylobacterium sp. TaxID=1871053 RepID=UPI002ED81C95
MSTATDTAREEALLLELAELGMGMARQLHAVTLATTETDTLIALATAFRQVGRGVRQSLALRARFAAGTVAAERPARAEATTPPSTPRPQTERADWNDYERPDWNERFATRAEPLDLEQADGDPEVCIARIARDLTVVSRTPALAAIPALRPQAARLAGRAALLAGGALRLVDTS